MGPLSRMGRITTILALAAVLFPTSTALGRPSVPEKVWLTETRGRVAAVRAALEGGSFVRRLTALTGASTRPPGLPTPSASEAAAVASLPTPAGAAVAGLA